MGRRKKREGGGGGAGGGFGAGGGGVTTAVGEAARLSLQLQLRQLADSEAAELVLPSSLSLSERAYVHHHAALLGLSTKSRGAGGKRYVTVYKRSKSTLVQKDAVLVLDNSMRQVVSDLLDTHPITTKEKDDLNSCEREKAGHLSVGGSLSAGVPQIPNSQYSSDMLSFKKSLPVANYRDQIIDLINTNQVVVVVGETGSGKTTQIPQMILDHHQKEKKKCRLICTQPRRISAVSVAERVAYERNEKVGHSIGYQIRLESRTSSKTVLTYCTNGVLLRTLMGGGSVLSSISHILVDEVHERDKFADFLLISLKDAVTKHKDLHVILMSATIDASLFSRYFNNCPIMNIPGKMFDVQQHFLEDILQLTKYKSEAMKKIEHSYLKNQKLAKENSKGENLENAMNKMSISNSETIDPSLQTDVDEFLEDCLNNGTLDSFGQILYLYISEGVPVDCQHSETGMTGLMAAAHHGYIDTIEEIIKMGGSPNVVDKMGKQAHDYAFSRGHAECVNFLKNLVIEPIQTSTQESDENDIMLDIYQQSVLEDKVDIDLLLSVIKYIHLTQPKGGILVFLTGYDDIVFLRDAIQTCSEMRQGSYQLFTLHSNMQTSDQKKVFVRSPVIRKIIISTNIAETSITIDDIVYVVDSGKVKELYYEALTGVSSLQRTWISKACAIQRAGRAGRLQPGKVFMMYSKRRFKSFSENTTAEILRVPLHELCLHTKLLAPCNTPIADYLSKALEPPSFIMIRNAVSLLKTIGALTLTEDLTEIGQHLLGLTIEPKLGKMILYACILKCLDPVLTIACCLAVKEPFQLNPNKDSRKSSDALRKEFSADSLSDHMSLLRVFQAWQTACTNKAEKNFCEKNLINKATMEMIVGFRTQLVAQLRAIGFIKARGVGDIRDVNQNSEKWYVVKAALVGGLYPSIARIDREESVLRSSREAKLLFHPGSALNTGRGKSGLIQSLNKIPSDWIAFENIVRIGRLCYIRYNTVVTTLTVALFGGPLRLSSTAITNLPGFSDDSDSDQDENDPSHLETSSLSLDDWMSFIAASHDVLSIYFLRQKFSALLIRKMTHPNKSTALADDKVISTIVQVLGVEEKKAGLIQPSGIGLRPKVLSLDSQNMRQSNDSDYSYSGSSAPNSFYNKQNSSALYNNQKGHYFKQGKSQQGQMFQHYPNKGPLSPPSGNILLANIEKYTNSNSENVTHLQNSHYFVIRANDTSTIENSQITGLWNFNPTTAKRLTAVAETGSKVILFFSICETISRFFGYAEFLNAVNENDSSSHHIKWISTQIIPHYITRNLLNNLNDNRRIFASLDGQEVSADGGKSLIIMFEQNSKKYTRNNSGRPIQKQTAQS